ncbi:hypothetical protein [Xanthomonas phaseoli]|uniref:hypothetical protein n=1 Tax=Xanthomonas phaseoli TaxID=1985254 RepID=UPI00135F1712|nr:hypothetical protein [Xanthomonas phaseoli]
MFKPSVPTISTGPCLLTFAAWMSLKRLQGRIAAFRAGGHARVLQPNRRSAALQSGITQRLASSQFPISHSHPAHWRMPWQIELAHD